MEGEDMGEQAVEVLQGREDCGDEFKGCGHL